MKKFLIATAALVVAGLLLMGGCLALIGGAADEVSKEIDKGTTSARVDADGDTSEVVEEGKDFTWKGLKVSKDEFGFFDGSIRVTNTTDEPKEVFVSVTAYDGDQTLGSIDGSSRIKPGATSKVKVVSGDEFAKATDFEVEISGF